MDFRINPTGIGFKLFGAAHLAALGIILATNLALLLLRPLLGEPGRRCLRFGLAAVLVLSEVAISIWLVQAGLWTIRDNLPLQLCSVMTLLAAVLLLTRSHFLYELVYFLGVGGALQALVTPPLGSYGYPHLYFFEEFISHGGVVTAAVYMTLVEGYRPTWRALWRAAGCMLAYMAFIMGINAWLGSNYLFIAHKPGFPSLIDELGPWPWYILSLIAVGLVTVLLLYLPFALKDWRARRAGRRARAAHGPVAGTG